MSGEKKQPRVPNIVGGIQVNFCKVPSCFNFGCVPSFEVLRGRGKAGKSHDTYAKSGRGKGVPGFKCKHCGTSFTIKSNQGIYEEYERIKAYLIPDLGPSCPETDCPNHSVPLKRNPSFYQSYGKSPSGYHKYRCKHCKRYFTVGTPSRGQKKPHLNIEVFRCLVAKMPLRCIMEKLDISSTTLYGKIDFIRQQALAFVANRERRLLRGMEIPELQVAVDRQEYVVNWNNQAVKRNTRLLAIGSADNITGYVFGMNLNFDADLSSEEIEVESAMTGDYKIPQKPFRRFARLWLKGDYEESKAKSKQRRGSKTVNAGEVNEELDKHDITTRLPIAGMQVHAEYTMFGHFFHLQDLFKGVKKLTFYMDEEAGIQGACNAAFETEIRNGNCQAFVVRIKKDLTVNERRRAIRDALRHLRLLGAHYSPFGVKISYDDIAKMHLEDLIKSLRSSYKVTHGPVDWKNRSIGHPLPRMNEPDKTVNYITEQPYELAPDELAELFLNATLGGIDRFFMQVRRKLSPLERPIGTASNMRRIWYGYSPYNPLLIQKLLDIYRVYYNYVKVGQDKQTPAMRIGLARSPLKMEDILYYS